MICVMILLSGGGGGGGDVGSGESQVPKASLPSRITSSFVRHIPGRRKYDSRAACKIFTFSIECSLKGEYFGYLSGHTCDECGECRIFYFIE